MTFSSCLTDSDNFFIADASVAINLNATRCIDQIINSLPGKMVITDIAMEEVRAGPLNGRLSIDPITRLIESNAIDVVSLSDIGMEIYANLITGHTTETLDDGEAATIAYAVEGKGLALIDEKKAVRIAKQKFPSLSLASTLDIVAHPDIQQALGTDGLSNAVLNALQDARMGVSIQAVDWVVGLIGVERALLCSSLPKQYIRQGT